MHRLFCSFVVQLADVLIDIASIIQGLKDEKLLRDAQVSPTQRFTLSKIVHSVEQMPSRLPYFLHAGVSFSLLFRRLTIETFCLEQSSIPPYCVFHFA
jgi:hypothetical protein